MVKIIIMRGGN